MRKTQEKEFIQRLINEHSNLSLTNLRPEDLSVPAYRSAYKELLKQISDGVKADLRSISSSLPEYLGDLAKLNSVESSNFKHYESILKKEIWREGLEIIYDRAFNDLRNGEEPIAVSRIVNQGVLSLILDDGERRAKTIYEISNEFGPILEERVKMKGELPGIRTGINDLDKLIGGFQMGTYYIGARPSQGKTALMLTIARAAMNEGRSVGIISIESSETELITRLWAADASIDIGNLKSGTGFIPSDFSRLENTVKSYKKKNGYIYFDTKMDVSGLEAIARNMVKGLGVDIILVDYLQRINSSGVNKFDQVSKASRAITDIAKGLKIPVVCLAQTGRQADKEIPGLGHFQHSSAIEQDADVAIIIQPPDPAAPDNKMHWVLNVLKNRDGEIGMCAVHFNMKYVRFESWNGPKIWEENK